MKESDRLSPFAAKSSQEQKEQWIWWQCQKDAVVPVQEEEPAEQSSKEQAKPEKSTEPVCASAVMRPSIHHGQYDAVIKRMKTATQQARVYTSVEPESTRQPLSGNPKKEE